MTKLFTLCFIHQSPRILLGMKKVGFGAGRWNGFGGRVEPGETIEHAVVREMREESGLNVSDLEKRGVMQFSFQDKPDILEVHIFAVRDFTGELIESDEMRPEWFSDTELPYHTMWPSDVHWIPLFLAGKHFQGRTLFGPGDVIVEHWVEEVGR